MRLGIVLLIDLLQFSLGASPVLAENRVALVIGNDLYSNLGPSEQLERARRDARAVGDRLEALGFAVIRVENATRQQMVDAVFDLAERLKPGDTALFYYAGHGVAIEGSNYLLPADIPAAGAGQESRIRNAAIGEADIIADVKAKGARIVILVLDACRNNPFRSLAGRSVGGERGLARVETASGVFSIYSAGFGESALDRLGETDSDPNSVFTRNFLEALSQPGLTLVQIAKRTQETVQNLAASVRHEQTPAYYDQIVGDIVLNRPALASTDPDAVPRRPSAPVPLPNQTPANMTLEQKAQAFMEARLVAAMGTPSDVFDYVLQNYATNVVYYGKETTRGAIAADKAKYFTKWPIRRYTLVPGTTNVSCDEVAQSCLLTGQTDYVVSNGTKTLSGRATIEVAASFLGGKVQVTVENGHLLSQ